jgi:hypothetical protein
MNAIDARIRALKSHPDLDRLYYITLVEINQMVNKGKFEVKKPFSPDDNPYMNIIKETLRIQGYTVEFKPESHTLIVKW